jgi:hypothetical protein
MKQGISKIETRLIILPRLLNVSLSFKTHIPHRQQRFK